MMNIQQTIDSLAVGSLPKWPQMLVTGKPVSIDQAKEIIFLTDDFFTNASDYSGGNDHEFNRNYRKLAGLNQLQVEKRYPEGHAYNDADWGRMYAMRNAIGVLSLEYIGNDWASSSFIGGPHGWCHPDGTISFGDNVGKWPSIEEVLDEWVGVARAFPFLDLHVTLMSGESCEDSDPVINIRVINGTATLEAPDDSVHNNITNRSAESLIASFISQMHSPELGLPEDWYDEFAARVRTAIAELPQEVS